MFGGVHSLLLCTSCTVHRVSSIKSNLLQPVLAESLLGCLSWYTGCGVRLSLEPVIILGGQHVPSRIILIFFAMGYWEKGQPRGQNYASVRYQSSLKYMYILYCIHMYMFCQMFRINLPATFSRLRSVKQRGKKNQPQKWVPRLQQLMIVFINNLLGLRSMDFGRRNHFFCFSVFMEISSTRIKVSCCVNETCNA